jgi:hypothetical protein
VRIARLFEKTIKVIFEEEVEQATHLLVSLKVAIRVPALKANKVPRSGHYKLENRTFVLVKMPQRVA